MGPSGLDTGVGVRTEGAAAARPSYRDRPHLGPAGVQRDPLPSPKGGLPVLRQRLRQLADSPPAEVPPPQESGKRPWDSDGRAPPLWALGQGCSGPGHAPEQSQPSETSSRCSPLEEPVPP